MDEKIEKLKVLLQDLLFDVGNGSIKNIEDDVSNFVDLLVEVVEAKNQ